MILLLVPLLLLIVTRGWWAPFAVATRSHAKGQPGYSRVGEGHFPHPTAGPPALRLLLLARSNPFRVRKAAQAQAMADSILFACVHNAGRSQMAAAWFDALVDPKLAHAVSAGSVPGSRVHPEVLEAMKEVGIDLSDKKPQLLTKEVAEKSKLLVTMGCGEACPYVPGLERVDWQLQDPKGQGVETVRLIRDDIKRRIQLLVQERGYAKTKDQDRDLVHPSPPLPVPAATATASV